MIELAEAQTRLLALAAPLPVERAGLLEAAGRWAAEPVLAKRTQPLRDLSAMDGYAIAHAGLPGPWRVIGESAAGVSFGGAVEIAEAVRIFTGAALPDGTDTIVIQEDTTRTGNTLVIDPELTIAPGQHVRKAGSDFAAGQVLIEAGDLLTPARIALAAMGEHGTIAVRRRPSICIVATGDELVPPGSEPGPDQIPESNATMIAAMLRDLRCTVTSPGIVGDDRAALASVFAATEADILVTCGGASVGDHDLVRPALEDAGAEMDFWKVAMRPGKPVMAGRLDETVVLGLPGNPVSAFVTALLLLKPMIAHLSGARDPLPRRTTVRLGAPLRQNGPRLDHVRARLEGDLAFPASINDSAQLAALAASDALIVRQPHAPAAEIGEKVEIVRL